MSVGSGRFSAFLGVPLFAHGELVVTQFSGRTLQVHALAALLHVTGGGRGGGAARLSEHCTSSPSALTAVPFLPLKTRRCCGLSFTPVKISAAVHSFIVDEVFQISARTIMCNTSCVLLYVLCVITTEAWDPIRFIRYSAVLNRKPSAFTDRKI